MADLQCTSEAGHSVQQSVQEHLHEMRHRLAVERNYPGCWGKKKGWNACYVTESSTKTSFLPAPLKIMPAAQADKATGQQYRWGLLQLTGQYNLSEGGKTEIVG